MTIRDELTDEQKAKITEIAIDTVCEDVLQNPSRMCHIISEWISELDTQDQIDQISGDEDVVEELLGFHPYNPKKQGETDEKGTL